MLQRILLRLAADRLRNDGESVRGEAGSFSFSGLACEARSAGVVPNKGAVHVPGIMPPQRNGFPVADHSAQRPASGAAKRGIRRPGATCPGSAVRNLQGSHTSQTPCLFIISPVLRGNDRKRRKPE
jgi:hypothetical protein